MTPGLKFSTRTSAVAANFLKISFSCAHALKRWKATSSVRWLVASMSLIDEHHPALESLLQAAKKVRVMSPAYPTVAYRVARILLAEGRTEELRTHLDAVLAQTKKTLPRPSLNTFMTMRARLARSMDEYLRYTIQTPAAVLYDDGEDFQPGRAGEAERMALFSDPSFFNTQMPLPIFRDAAKSNTLGVEQRRNLLLTTWVRAIILKDYDLASEVSVKVGEAARETKQYVERFAAEKDPADKEFAAVFCLLHFPGFHPYLDGEFRAPIQEIDSFRDNWWCIKEKYSDRIPDWLGGREWSENERIAREAGYPSFLSEQDKMSAAKEQEQLRAGPNAPNYLCETVLKWGKEHPDDKRVPEALHLAVRSTRYGCTDSATGRYSKQAFRLLHSAYPRSEWAQKTPYWFRD